MRKVTDMTGSKHGRLTVLALSYTLDGRAYWACRCDCGKEKTVIGYSLRRGSTVSCGCLSLERFMKGRRPVSNGARPMYDTWRSIISRCNNPNHQAYKWYGGRGIKVCRQWEESLDAFAEYVGERPKGATIDRIKNELGYEPGNVRWATRDTQNGNKRSNRIITAFGRSMPVFMWAKDPACTVSHETLRSRLRGGWDPEAALVK